LLYLGKTISLTVEETSFIVAAVLGGSMFSSLVAGILADLFGRKKMMVVSGLMFVGSVGLIVISQAFLPLFLGETTGWLVTACLCLFIASFSVGPGVVVWLALSELMPTRIRSTGMGIALLLNQGVATGIAAVFLPTVGNFGYSAMFFFWAACTVIYFITAAFFLPETKGKTLEEIEEYFETAKLSPNLQKRAAS
jgi:MFS family permease